LFGRYDHPFVSTECVSSAARKRRQGWPEGHRRRRRGLDRASTALGWFSRGWSRLRGWKWICAGALVAAKAATGRGGYDAGPKGLV